MPRCAAASFAAAVLIASATLASTSADAQVHRNFPKTALRGAIAFGSAPPAIQLNGNDALLAPGVRIHGMDNMLKMTAALEGQKYVVDYSMEATGMVHEVWLLTPDEVKVSPWPTTPVQAATWVFDPIANTWTIP